MEEENTRTHHTKERIKEEEPNVRSFMMKN